MFELLVIRTSNPGCVSDLILRQTAFQATASQLHAECSGVRLPGRRKEWIGHRYTVADLKTVVCTIYLALLIMSEIFSDKRRVT